MADTNTPHGSIFGDPAATLGIQLPARKETEDGSNVWAPITCNPTGIPGSWFGRDPNMVVVAFGEHEPVDGRYLFFLCLFLFLCHSAVQIIFLEKN